MKFLSKYKPLQPFLSKPNLNPNLNPTFSTQTPIKPSIDLIKALRNETNSPLSQIQKALIEANNNLEEAKVWLKKKGFKDAENKMKRDSNFQIFGIKTNKTELSLTELTCETDFVSKTELFKELASNLMTCLTDKRRDLTSLCLDSIRFNSKNFIGEVSLNEAVRLVISKTGEKCTIKKTKFYTAKPNEIIGVYLHNKLYEDYCTAGSYCILSLSKKLEELSKSQLKDIEKLTSILSMQVVAMSPKYISSEKIPEAKMRLEKSIVIEKIESNQKGKSMEVVGKMIESAMRKYFEETCLLQQEFVIHNEEEECEDGRSKVSLKVEDVIKQYESRNEVRIEVVEFENVRLGC